MGDVTVAFDEDGEGGRVGILGATGGGGGIRATVGVAPGVAVAGRRVTERWELGGWEIAR